MLKAVRLAAAADDNGNFSITTKNGNTLIVSFAGMKTLEYQVGINSTAIEILMDENASANLNEVVVIGYGTQKVTKISGGHIYNKRCRY